MKDLNSVIKRIRNIQEVPVSKYSKAEVSDIFNTLDSGGPYTSREIRPVIKELAKLPKEHIMIKKASLEILTDFFEKQAKAKSAWSLYKQIKGKTLAQKFEEVQGWKNNADRKKVVKLIRQKARNEGVELPAGGKGKSKSKMKENRNVERPDPNKVKQVQQKSNPKVTRTMDGAEKGNKKNVSYFPASKEKSGLTNRQLAAAAGVGIIGGPPVAYLGQKTNEVMFPSRFKKEEK